MVYIEGMNIQIRDVDPELHRKFKMVTVAKGTSIQRLVIALIEECVREHKALLPTGEK